MIKHSVSVRNLIELVYAGGDIDNRIRGILGGKRRFAETCPPVSADRVCLWRESRIARH
jgi:hypothetical protein